MRGGCSFSLNRIAKHNVEEKDYDYILTILHLAGTAFFRKAISVSLRVCTVAGSCISGRPEPCNAQILAAGRLFSLLAFPRVRDSVGNCLRNAYGRLLDTRNDRSISAVHTNMG